MVNLGPLVDAHLSAAHASDRGRSAEVVIHDGALRQSVVALVAAATLDEHASPPAGTLQVLRGRILVTEDDVVTELADGDLWQLTKARHGVEAREDSVFLLTAVTGVERAAQDPA